MYSLSRALSISQPASSLATQAEERRKIPRIPSMGDFGILSLARCTPKGMLTLAAMPYVMS